MSIFEPLLLLLDRDDEIAHVLQWLLEVADTVLGSMLFMLAFSGFLYLFTSVPIVGGVLALYCLRATCLPREEVAVA